METKIETGYKNCRETNFPSLLHISLNPIRCVRTRGCNFHDLWKIAGIIKPLLLRNQLFSTLVRLVRQLFTKIAYANPSSSCQSSRDKCTIPDNIIENVHETTQDRYNRAWWREVRGIDSCVCKCPIPHFPMNGYETRHVSREASFNVYEILTSDTATILTDRDK